MPDKKAKSGVGGYLAEATALSDGRLDAAIGVLRKAARASGDKYQVYRTLSRLQRAQRQHTDAITSIRKAIRLARRTRRPEEHC